jgi:hypothetical protein
LTGDGRHPTGVEDTFASATELELADPGLVADVSDQLRAAAEQDHREGGVPRGVAYIRRLQELAVERPVLAVAVSRALGLEHIVDDLLRGIAVEGVPGIGPDGVVVSPTRRHRTRRRGKLILVLSALLLLVEAVIADGLASILLYVWTAVALGLFFFGGYLIMLRE